MICISISDPDVEKCIELLTDAQMGEIRLDLTRFSNKDIERIFSLPIPLIATCRPDGLTEKQQLETLETAIRFGAKYVDVEYEAPQPYKDSIIKLAKAHQCAVIISYHNYQNTPVGSELEHIMQQCFAWGADVAKLATMANDKADVARILGLYQHNKRLVALGMGEPGKISRVLALVLGAEFTFAAPNNGQATAPGQLTQNEILQTLKHLKNL